MKKSLLGFFLFSISAMQGYAYDYDLVVIGCGLAGLGCSVLASDLDKRVAVIERYKIGGTRMWTGDYPFNALLKEAELFHSLRHNRFGIKLPDLDLKPDLFPIMERVRMVQERIYNAVDWDYMKKCNAIVFYGEPRFLDAHTLALNGKVLTTKNVIIATGTRSRIPDIKNIENVEYYTRENFFQQTTLPEEAVVVGGGPLGVEIATILSCFGVKVKLFMKHRDILLRRDSEMVAALKRLLALRGVEFYCSTEVVAANQDGDTIAIVARDKTGREEVHSAQALYIATGSVPNLEKLDLERVGIKYTSMGLPVNEKMQTNISNIYACGDVIGWASQSRWVEFQFKSVIYHLYGQQFPEYAKIDKFPIARAIFSSPMFVSIGLTEDEAIQKYPGCIKVYKRSYDIIERAHIDQTTEGLIKFVCDDQGVLLGAHIMGEQAEAIVEHIKLGQDIRNAFRKVPTKVSVWSGYFDLIERLGYDCFNDLKHVMQEENPSWFYSVMGGLLFSKSGEETVGK